MARAGDRDDVWAAVCLLLLVLLTIGLVALPIILYYRYDLRGDDLTGVVFPAAFVGFAILSWLLTRIGKLTAESAEEARARDPRPPVLYLRSFAADRADERRRLIQYVTRNRTGAGDSVEEGLVKSLGEAIGPVVAVGRPGERLPALGAARAYFEDDEWRDRVTELLDESALVVIRAGSSPGLEWELRTAVDSCPPEKLMLLLPKRSYRAFRGWANDILPQPLPEGWPGEALAFLPDWTPLVAVEVGDGLELRPLEVAQERIVGHGPP